MIMGVSGCGKSTISRELGKRQGWVVIEGDDYHPKSNVEKMAQGVSLTDTDRESWLGAINQEISAFETSPLILACSALTPYVQRCLKNVEGRNCIWILLEGTPELIKKRLDARSDHFMTSTLLESQFSALAPPDNAIIISIDQTVNDIVQEIVREAKLDKQH